MKLKRRVVVIGGGFGGLSAARGLSREPVHVTLLDRRNHHLFQPLLYQVAMAGLAPAEIAVPIRAVLSRQQNARVLLTDVTSVDLAKKRVETREKRAKIRENRAEIYRSARKSEIIARKSEIIARKSGGVRGNLKLSRENPKLSRGNLAKPRNRLANAPASTTNQLASVPANSTRRRPAALPMFIRRLLRR